MPGASLNLGNKSEHFTEDAERVAREPRIPRLRKLHRIRPRTPLRERRGAREDRPLARDVVRDKTAPLQQGSPRLERTLQGAERVRLMRSRGSPLHIEEPLRRLDDRAVPDNRDAELPRLVRPAALVSRRLKVYRREFHSRNQRQAALPSAGVMVALIRSQMLFLATSISYWLWRFCQTSGVVPKYLAKRRAVSAVMPRRQSAISFSTLITSILSKPLGNFRVQ